jgi:hypothetical protein
MPPSLAAGAALAHPGAIFAAHETFSASRASKPLKGTSRTLQGGQMGYLQERDRDEQQRKMLRDEWLGGSVTFAFVALVVASLVFGPF